MRRAWQIAGVGLAGLFAAALYLSLGYSLSDALGPGSGFFPFWLSVIGLGLCALLLLEASKTDQAEDADMDILPRREAAWRTGSVLAALVAAAALLEPLGFRLTMLPFIAGLLVVLGARSPLAIGAVASAGSFGVFHVFYYWLKVPLPVGTFGL